MGSIFYNTAQVIKPLFLCYFSNFFKIAPAFWDQVFGVPRFESDVLVNKGEKKIFTKIHHPHFILFYLIIKRDNPIVFGEGDIKQPFHDGGFSHFAAGQDGGTMGFLFFDVVDPFEEIGQFFYSTGEQLGFTDSFF